MGPSSEPAVSGGDDRLIAATAHHRAGRWPQAIRLAKQVLAEDPADAEALRLLGVISETLGQPERGAELLEQAVAHDPGFARAWFNLGNLYLARSRVGEAVAAYTRCAALLPGDADVHRSLGVALEVAGRLDDARAALDRALECRPGDAKVNAALGDLLLVSGDFAGALAACDACLQADPGNERALAFKAVALEALGERDAVRRLVDFDRFIRTAPVAAPAGFDDVGAFNAALADFIRNDPMLEYEPANKTTRIGRQTRELLVEPRGPVAALDGLIRQAVDDYVAAVAPEPPHPFFAGRPDEWRLTGWAVILESGGHQTPHLHPSCWLSGVYYVAVPEVVGAEGEDQAGWIEFGRPEDRFALAVEPEVRAYRPEQGLMVLFPSFFFHRTIPFESAEERISVAFDVLREA